MRSTPTIDLHAHPGAFHRPRTGELPLSALEDMQAGGVDAAFFAVVTDGPVLHRSLHGIRQVREPHPGELRGVTLALLDRVLVRVREGRLPLALGPTDLAAPAAQPVALLALEGGDGLEGDPARVADFHRLGVRSIQLVHYRVNELGDVQTEAPRHHGLTGAGREVVAEMNRLGMIVDGAHASPETLHDVLAVSRHPVIVSHTGPAGRRPESRRHLADGGLRDVADAGGVIGLWPLARPPLGLDALLDDVEYACQLVGTDHVGIGTDMAGLRTATALPSYRDFPALRAGLAARGFAAADLDRLLGGNLLRVFEQVAGAG
ncbi:MAG TPA: membrane dipeptidase [Methylomirabilota bacterium]|nr:membrane dipeptidase [Methylomirabilota bacterium]